MTKSYDPQGDERFRGDGRISQAEALRRHRARQEAQAELSADMLTALKAARSSIVSGFDTVAAIAAIDAVLSRAEA